MLRRSRALLRLLVTAVAGSAIALVLTFALGKYVAPLRWTSSELADQLVRDAERDTATDTSDVHIELSTERVTVVRHEPFSYELGDAVERVEGTRRLEVRAHETRLEAGECLALRMFLSGSDWLAFQHASVVQAGQVVAERSYYPMFDDWRGITGSSHRTTARIAWCSPNGGDVLVRLWLASGFDDEPRPLEWIGSDHVVHVIVARTAAPEQLASGVRDLAPRGQALWTAARDPVDADRVVGSVLWSEWHGEIPLLPETPAVWGALVDASARETGVYGNPRAHVGSERPATPFARPDTVYPRGQAPSQSYPVIRNRGVARRVLAAVDMGDLGVACAHIALTREDMRFEPPDVEVLDIPSLGLRTLPRREETSTDPACASRGLRLYLVTERDHASYQVRVLRGELPEGAPGPEPSTYEGPLPVPGQRGCASGDLEACEALGLRLAFWPALAARRAESRAALSTACEGGRRNGCLGLAISEPSDLPALIALCDASPSSPLACMHLGDAYRRAAHREASDPENRSLAMAAYGRACAGGIPGACTNQLARYP